MDDDDEAGRRTTDVFSKATLSCYGEPHASLHSEDLVQGVPQHPVESNHTRTTATDDEIIVVDVGGP